MSRTLRCAAGLAVILALTGAECRPWLPVPRPERVADEPGLVQNVVIEPAEPRAGERIRILSVVTNVGSRTITATFKDCGLGFGGDLALQQPADIPRCLSFSIYREVAPGESVTMADVMDLRSPQGTYGLEVFHVFDFPPARIEVRVVE